MQFGSNATVEMGDLKDHGVITGYFATEPSCRGTNSIGALSGGGLSQPRPFFFCKGPRTVASVFWYGDYDYYECQKCGTAR